MNEAKLKELVGKYREDIFQDTVDARGKEQFYREFSRQKLSEINDSDLERFIVQLWSMGLWGDRQGHVRKSIFPKNENNYRRMGEMLAEFIHGACPLADRWDSFNLYGFGPAMKSELLFHFHRTECVVWNTPTRRAFGILGVPSLPSHNYQVSGEKYQDICNHAKEILARMKVILNEEVSMTEINSFIWQLSQYENGATPDASAEPWQTETSSPQTDLSWHNELKEKIAEIGVFLGFESDTEVSIGASRYDAVWKFKIGNMGQIAYVFEVQSKGSVDRLIVNLLTAANRPDVQAVVAVSDDKQLQLIDTRFKGTDVNYHKLKKWHEDDVVRVHEKLTEVNFSLNELGLVPKPEEK